MLKFETKDGGISEHPPNKYNYSKVTILPYDATVKRIRVYTYNKSYIEAIEFCDKDSKSILKAGRTF